MHGTEEEVVLVGIVVIIIIFALGKLHTNNSMLKNKKNNS